MFDEFDGTVGEPAVQWLAEVRRYWKFTMREHNGQEVMFTLPKLKKEAATWFASDQAPVFGPDGVGCPPELFVELFTARFIAPHLKSHAFEGVDGIR